MNCATLWFPTFLAPAGSKGGPPLEPVAGACPASDDAFEAAGVGGEAPLPNPQPVFPCWVAVPGPEQIPVGLVQHPLAQLAFERHCPVMNCMPLPLPTFFTLLGSKGGTAATKEVRAKIVVVIMMNFIMVVGVIVFL